MNENQKAPIIAIKQKSGSMEELKGMSVRQMFYLNGLGTKKNNPPKAIQIMEQEKPKL